MAIEVSTQRGRLAKASAASALQRYRCANPLWALACAFAMNTAVLAQTGPQSCGNPFVNHYGPYDYRSASPATRKIVEEVHFTVGIETMTRPKNTMFHEMAQDVEYTLNVFPNHHRALITMSRLAERWKRDPPPGTNVSVECWFDRAVRFRPEDTVARSLYAQWLNKRQRQAEGSRQLRVAVDHAKDNPMSHYNIGLVALEIKDFELALSQAHKARELGFPRQELEEALKRANRWADPVASAAAAPPLPSASDPARAAASSSGTGSSP